MPSGYVRKRWLSQKYKLRESEVAMLISYVNNRYLEKVYQQFPDGYVLMRYFASEKIIRSRRSC